MWLPAGWPGSGPGTRHRRFVTAAINDRAVDEALQLRPLREAAIALVGFGPRAAEIRTMELDHFDPVELARS